MGYFDKFRNDGIPFMEGRDKGDLHDMLDVPVHIIDFGFIKGKNGDFAVIALAEDSGKFYFCNSIITEMLRTVQADDMQDALPQQAIVFSLRMSKAGQEYMTFEFE